MTASHDAQQHQRHPTFKQYVLVATSLFLITIIEFLLIYDRVGIDDDLGAATVPLLIGLSGIKFATVIMFYMHLKFDSRLFSWIFLAGLALAFAVGLAVLGLFVALQGEPREFAEAHAQPYVEDEEHAVAEEIESESITTEAGGVNTLQIDVAGDALQFDTGSLTASAGAEVALTFNNSSSINQHNWVLVTPGTKDAVATAGTTAGPNNDWISPNDSSVLFHTTLLDPGQSEEIRFTLEAGTYQFVCTFPGHNATMFGDLEVTS